MSQTSNDGRGISKLTTADEQNELRRAKKAKQKKSGSGPVVDGYLAGLQEDRRIQRETAKAARELDAHTFRCNQANKAWECEELTVLKKGSLSHRVAELMLEAFPMAEVFTENGRTINRTESAYRTALGKLRGDEVMRTSAIYCGKARTRKALIWAYDALKADA